MKIVKTPLFLPLVFLVAMGFIMGETMEARALSKEIAPDIPPAVLEKLLPDAKVYMTGSGPKEVLLLADSFCENSRNAYRLLQNRLDQIRTVRILWVSAFAEKGSEIAAAAAMKMQASGKGESALKAVFEMPIPPSAEIGNARENALTMVNEKFRADLGEMDLHRLKPELEQLQRNTNLAKEIGYTGTPHFIVDGRVLHGYSGPAIRIL
ncbi:MAG: hypothetical protein IH628_12555, partial [Proteobacteria bacterium]|nr:hypothetical protein [Pseudomonadota bacterium]